MAQPAGMSKRCPRPARDSGSHTAVAVKATRPGTALTKKMGRHPSPNRLACTRAPPTSGPLTVAMAAHAPHITPDEARVITQAMTRVIQAHGAQPDTANATDVINSLYRIAGVQPAGDPDTTQS